MKIIRWLALGDFAVTYELHVYADGPTNLPKMYTDLHRNVLDVVNEYGVQIMAPEDEGDPDILKVAPREHWNDAPAHRPAPGP